MIPVRIPMVQTKRFSRLILDYLNGSEAVRSAYSAPHELASYKGQMEARGKFPIDRPLLVNCLLKQYSSIGGCKDKVLENVRLLADDRTFTVTTGHQLNIFTGPLYFVYKIICAVKLAEELGRTFPDSHFVPVYWMATEDHDLEEISNFNLFGKKYVWKTPQTGVTGKMGPHGLSDICDQLAQVLSGNEQALKMVGMFRKAYAEHADLATATRYFIDQLFGRYGLVILDGDDAELKRSFSDFVRTDLLDNVPQKMVLEQIRELGSSYHVQVYPREINSFYLMDGVRERIVSREDGFHVLHSDIEFTREGILSELQEHPERFSPNVVLRPLYQEHVLPNLAYVGGAGELAYWLEFRTYFKEMGVSFPLLALRSHFLVIDRSTSKRMKGLGIGPEDLFGSVDGLIKQYLLGIADSELDLSEAQGLLRRSYQSLADKAQETDASLVSAVKAEEQRQQKMMEQWESRFTRALKKRHEVDVSRIRNTMMKLFPDGHLQERHDNILSQYARSGASFIEEIYRLTDPFSNDFQVLLDD